MLLAAIRGAGKIAQLGPIDFSQFDPPPSVTFSSPKSTCQSKHRNMKPFGPTILALVTNLALAAFPLTADTLTCPTRDVTINYDQKSNAALACEAVEQTLTLFSQCNLPFLPDRLQIDIVQSLEPGCVGLFHCGQDRIAVLAPDLMKPVRDPEGTFAFLPSDEYFQSVIVHEMTHAATENTPCPFDACPVSMEYMAYAIQIMSMKTDARVFLYHHLDTEQPVSRDDLSFVLLLMAPNVFAEKVGAHFSQRDDSCGFLRDLASGSVLLDRERF